MTTSPPISRKQDVGSPKPIEADATDLTFANLNRWWNVISEPTRFRTAAIAWTCFWLLLLWRRSRPLERRRLERESTTVIWRSVIMLALATGILSAGTLAVDRLLPEGGTAGVLTRSDVTLRTGNGLSFESAIDEPLSEGVEFGILDQRPGWWRIRLPDGTNGWIESNRWRVESDPLASEKQRHEKNNRRAQMGHGGRCQRRGWDSNPR